MRKLGIHCYEEHPRIRYTVDYLAKHPLVLQAGLQIVMDHPRTDNALNLVYGPQVGDQDFDFHIPAQRVFFTASVLPKQLYANPYTYRQHEVFSVEIANRAAAPFITDGRFQFDLLESIFFHISRYEEVFCPPEHRGEAGWLEETQHFLIRKKLYRQPVTDRLVLAFLDTIGLGSQARKTSYDLTHDIDFLFRYGSVSSLIRALAGILYRQERLKLLPTHVRRYYRIGQGLEKDPYDCFDWLLSADTHWEGKTLYLMAGGETRYDNHYRIDHPQIGQVISLAGSAGYQLGLHPSYNAGFRPESFSKEKAKLENVSGQKILKSRQHWLRWDWEITPYILDREGILEDASLGFRHHLGFRTGTGFPYFPYDFHDEKAFRWQERPMVLMESAAIHEAQNTRKNPIQLMDQLLYLNREGTHISINFHNSNFDSLLPFGTSLAEFYRQQVIPLGRPSDSNLWVH